MKNEPFLFLRAYRAHLSNNYFFTSFFIIIIIIMKSSIDRDNNYCHYVILRNAGFAITLHYHPAGSFSIDCIFLQIEQLPAY
jgi:hypothetical protein